MILLPPFPVKHVSHLQIFNVILFHICGLVLFPTLLSSFEKLQHSFNVNPCDDVNFDEGINLEELA